MSPGKHAILGSLLALSGRSGGGDDSNNTAAEYGRTVSPDGEVSAYVHHNNSPTSGLTYDYPPWGDSVPCVTETVKVQVLPIDDQNERMAGAQQVQDPQDAK